MSGAREPDLILLIRFAMAINCGVDSLLPVKPVTPDDEWRASMLQKLDEAARRLSGHDLAVCHDAGVEILEVVGLQLHTANVLGGEPASRLLIDLLPRRIIGPTPCGCGVSIGGRKKQPSRQRSGHPVSAVHVARPPLFRPHIGAFRSTA